MAKLLWTKWHLCTCSTKLSENKNRVNHAILVNWCTIIIFCIILILERLTHYLSTALFFHVFAFFKSKNHTCTLVTVISLCKTSLADAKPQATEFLQTTRKMSLSGPCRIPQINTRCSWGWRLSANWAQSTPETWNMFALAVLRVSCSRVNYAAAGLVTKHLSPSTLPQIPARCASLSSLPWSSGRAEHTLCPSAPTQKLW